MVKVKICGITNLEDAEEALRYGADALGFMFYKGSPRYIRPQQAKQIIRKLPKRILKIGVFVNAKEKTVRTIASHLRLDVLQFHGNESAEFCQRFKGYKIIKAFRIKDKAPLFISYNVWAYLFDSYCEEAFGGTGKTFTWDKLRNFKGSKKTVVFLSGGLNPVNVKRAIRIVCPDWVDASSSLEIRPGKKSPLKIRRFIHTAKG